MARGDKADYRAATFRLPPETLAELERESTETSMTKSTIVDKALKAWFGKDAVEKESVV